jgi:hypothetical protein
MSMHRATVPQLSKMLQNLDAWLAKANEHAKAKGYDVGNLLAARLAPDQYPLVRQVQAACDAAKFGGARLTGVEPPKHPDTETTIEELHARIAAVLEFLATCDEKAFEGAADRLVVLAFMQGKAMLGRDYLNEMVLPNFYFHVTTAYAILRHNGVDLGKRDFIGSLSIREV